MVLVDDRHHHFANVEGFLPPGIGLVRQDLADQREALLAVRAVRIDSHVAIDGIGRRGPPGEPLARRHVGVVIVAQQNVAGFIDVARPVLRLAVDAHDAVVAANALIVFGRDAAGVVQRALAGEHHRRFRRHDQNAPSVHEHGGFGVPVGLRADVDPVHHQIHFAARLRELDQAAQDAGDPIHVLHAAVHRDLGAGRDGEPLQGNALRFGQIQSGEDAPAFGFGDGAQILARISQQQNPRHAFGILGW